MKIKLNHACGLLAVFMLLVCLTPFPAQADEARKWEEIDKPGTSGNVVVSPSEVTEIAVGSSGVLYAVDSPNSKVYRSLDGGVTWEDITDKLAGAGAVLPATLIAVAPDSPGFVAAVTDNGSAVYRSSDGGINWVDTGVPALGSAIIKAIAISEVYTQDSKSLREIAIGTADWGNNTTDGRVWVYQVGKSWAPWEDQGLSVDPSHPGGEVSSLAYSPAYSGDMTILAVASTAADVAAEYQNGTYLCLGLRDTKAGTTLWNELSEVPTPDYPVEIAQSGDVSSGGDAIGVSLTSSMALPANYSGLEESSRWLFVSYNRQPDTGDDVYLLTDTEVARLDVDNGDPISISSIAYHGTISSGALLAGDAAPTASANVQVRRASEPFNAATTWEEATVPPTGPGNARLAWSPDGQLAYCGTGQTPGDSLDESALSASVDDGDKWRQLGLIDTDIVIADLAVAPDGESLFVTTSSASGPEGVWRSTTDPPGEQWQRLLTLDTATDAVILRLSPDYDDDHTIYAAEVGGTIMAVSHDRGSSWSWRSAPGAVVDIAVEDEDTVYVTLAGGIIKKSTMGGRVWRSQGDTNITDINMLSLAGGQTVIVGSRDGRVAYSTDGGASFTLIRDVIGSGSGNVQAAADANFSQNGVIYATTDIADEGIWRWVIGASDEWEQIDESITGLGGGQQIGGLAAGEEGTLYALRLETDGGVLRTLNPTADPADIELEVVDSGLPAGAAFDPTPFFPTLPYLKLSGDDAENRLWAIDTANQLIYRFRDTLCKLGPTPVAPRTREIIIIDSAGHIDSLTLQWEEIAGAEEYRVAIYSDAGAKYELWSATTEGLAIDATKTGSPVTLFGGTTYYWRVRAIRPFESPWSAIKPFTSPLGIEEWSPLAGNNGVSPLPGASDVSVTPAFTWQSAEGATGYEFILATDSGFTGVVASFTGDKALTSPAWNCDVTLEYSTSYFWKVRAVGVDSYSRWGVNTFTTQAAPAEPPPTPTPTVIGPAPAIPTYIIGIAIGVSAALVIVLLILIVRTRA